MKFGIIDTKAANLNSVFQCFKRLGLEAYISDDVNELKSADKLILPGVGTAQAVMQGVDRRGIREFILETKKPLLGICLGMQIMAERSAEVPLNSDLEFIPTLGIVPGTVAKLDPHGQTLPHMGWNTVEHTDHPLFKGIGEECYFYFVHSFRLDLGAYTIGRTCYGETFSSAIARDNFMGVQFHPEKSGRNGERLIMNFAAL